MPSMPFVTREDPSSNEKTRKWLSFRDRLMMPYRRNRIRQEAINRFGATAGLPLFGDKMTEPARSRLANAPKAIDVATDTRKLAHVILTHNTVELTKKQLVVRDAIEMIGPASNEEIADHLGWKINRVTGRTFELRTFGVVVPAGKRQCRITRNIVKTWRIK